MRARTGRERARPQGPGAGHARPYCESGGAQEVPRIGDAIVRMQTDGGAGFFKRRAVFHREIARLEFAPGGIDDDDG